MKTMNCLASLFTMLQVKMSENKSLSREDCMKYAINSLKNGAMRYSVLMVTDEVSNLRAIIWDYAVDAWIRSNRGVVM